MRVRLAELQGLCLLARAKAAESIWPAVAGRQGLELQPTLNNAVLIRVVESMRSD